MMGVARGLVLLCVLVCVVHSQTHNPLIKWIKENYADFTCAKNCSIPATDWGGTSHFCTAQGTVLNALCSNSQSSANCFGTTDYLDASNYDWTVLYPGECGCPSSCLVGTRGASCGKDGECTCKEGYTGEDCSQIDCGSQQCSKSGQCKEFKELGFSACECTGEGLALGDCSAQLSPLPAIPNLFPGTEQYDPAHDEYGDDHPIFNETTIAQIHLTISEEDLAFLTDPKNQDVRIYKHANFSFYNGAIEKRFENVGMRIKGGASRLYAKKSWKISFNTFEKGRKWYGQKRISLKDVAMDPTYAREKASLAALYAMNSPAQRVSHAVVFINKKVWGTYLLMEDPGTDEYLESRFGNAKGALWKCQGILEYLGPDPEIYREESYKGSNARAEADFGPLANFISVLNLTPQDQFEEQIQTVLDVDFFLRTLAAEVTTGNWDGIYNANNYFLYYNTDGLFDYYRHDLDISFGSLDAHYKMSNRSVWEWVSAPPQGRGYILPTRILSIPSFQDTFSTYLSLCMEYINTDHQGDWVQRVERIHNGVHAAVDLDHWHSLDNGMYGMSDYRHNLKDPVLRPSFWVENPFLTGDEWQPFMGVFEFVGVRNAATVRDLAEGPPPPQ